MLPVLHFIQYSKSTTLLYHRFAAIEGATVVQHTVFVATPSESIEIRVTQTAFLGSLSCSYSITHTQWAVTPRRTRDADKKKQRSEIHIHIAKPVYLDTHNPVVITIN